MPSRRSPIRGRRVRRGSALVLVLVFTLALGAMAMSAIFLNGSAAMLTRAAGRENDLRMSAEASLQMVKSYLNTDPTALPDSAFREFVVPGGTLTGADGQPMSGTTVRVWYGPTGRTTLDGTSFATVVAESRDAGGARHVRMLETARESFAKFAYYTTRESATGGTIFFTGGDVLFGPVWSNDVINISRGSGAMADFRDSVWTAQTINGPANASFRRGYQERQEPLYLPSTASLSRLRGIARAGALDLTAPTSGNETTVRMRLEFVAVDLNGDGDSTDTDEGFVRIYEALGGGPNGTVNASRWLRGDWQFGPTGNGNAAQRFANGTNCGDWHVDADGRTRFFPLAVHNQAWFRAQRIAAGTPAAVIDAEIAGAPAAVLSRANARCFLGGDPHLVAVADPTRQVGGTDATFYATGTGAAGAPGRWLPYAGGFAHPVLAARTDRGFLHPIGRGNDANVRGVIDVAGTVGVSGVVNGRVTLHANRSIVILDDLVYATRPGAAQCKDILGLVADRDIVIADNALLTPIDHDNGGGTVQRVMKPVPHLWLNGVTMALSTSFRVENFDAGPTSALACQGAARGRGCLNMDGGIIQFARGAVGTSAGTGYLKRYTYDRCAASNPPPYFPTTGRFADNRFTEIDPVGFDVQALFERMQPND